MNYLEEKIEYANGDLSILIDNLQHLREGNAILQSRLDRLKEKIYILYTHLDFTEFTK